MELAPNPAFETGPDSVPIRIDPTWPLAQWEDLSAHAAEPNAFYAPDLLIPALDHLARGRKVHLLEAREGENLVGLMPVSVERMHGRLPIPHVTNWTHRHCFLGAPLVRQGFEQAAWTSFLAQLDAARWAPHFLHLTGLDAAGPNAAALAAVCAAERRPMAELQRHDRAMLRSELSAEDYWTVNVRAKKRKEMRRLQARLAELGTVESRILANADDLPRWCVDFLALEASGWKGEQGSALACDGDDAAFFRNAANRAMAADRLLFLRIDLDDRPIAMLVNFRHGNGSFSFKIAIDETMGRYSPGVLIEIDNLRATLGNDDIAWMDSCAAADHPMIDSLWAERRSIAQYRIALAGSGARKLSRAAAFALVGTAERMTEMAKGQG